MRTFIPFNVPSLKNSKVATTKGVFMSKTCRKYLQSLGVKSYSVARKEVEGYKTRPNLFEACLDDLIEYTINGSAPFTVGFHFIRKTKAKFDYINAMQIILDLMTAHGVFEDDDCDNVIPYVLQIDGRNYSHDKDKPGVIIDVI